MNDNGGFICPECGHSNFTQEVTEVYSRCIDEFGNISEIENDLTHDLIFGPIRCANCGCECTDLVQVVCEE